MSGPQQHPRFRATEVGPGGIPAAEIRPVGERPAPPARSGRISASVGPAQRYRPALDDDAPRDGSPNPEVIGPVAVLGSFDAPTPPRRAVLGWLALAVVVAVVVAVSLWSGSSGPSGGAGDLRLGDCLSSAGGTAVIALQCSSPDVEFRIAARYDNSADSARCSAVSSDLVLVTRDDTVLCLNYLAKVGECLYAGAADDVGKAPCRTPGSPSTPPGLFRVLAVLSGTINDNDCPTGTIDSLVHVSTREVLCLGLP